MSETAGNDMEGSDTGGSDTGASETGARDTGGSDTGGSDTTARYHPLARLLHWVVAALVAVMFVLGIWMVYLPPANGQLRHTLYNLHESTGLLILLLVIARFVTRLALPPPPMTADLHRTVRGAAGLNHLFLYALLFSMPVIGYVATDALGIRVVWFEVLPLPGPHGRNDPEAHILSWVHFWGAMLLLGLVLLHLSGVCYHALIRRDDTLRRML